MSHTKVKMTFDCDGYEVTIGCPEHMGPTTGAAGGRVGAPDWSKFIQIAACVTSCLGGIGAGAGQRGAAAQGGQHNAPGGEGAPEHEQFSQEQPDEQHEEKPPRGATPAAERRPPNRR